MIEVRDLVKKYDNYLAVDHISFDIEPGKVYGFLGPNGAGKSTTLNIIAGCLSATEGTVRINGKDIYEEPKEAKKFIGYLPELPPLYQEMTAREYLAFVAELKRIPKKERAGQMEDVMKKTGIADVASRQMKQLSKGYRQRVGIAQAILGYPQAIILDEPTVGLDPIQIIEIRELIASLAKAHTVILSSHILGEVSAICDEIIIISKGKLMAKDTPENLEKLLAGANMFSFTVRGGEPEVRRALEGYSGVKIAPSREKGAVDATVRFKKDEDGRDALFLRFAEKRLPIISMQYERHSLEDIFIQLTSGGGAVKESGRGAKKKGGKA